MTDTAPRIDPDISVDDFVADAEDWLRANADRLPALAVENGERDVRCSVLFDPQTSGGLLIGVAADSARPG